MTLTKEQLELRRRYIGASEAAAVLGLSPFESPADVYWRKVSPTEEEKTPDAGDAIARGHRLEPALIDYARERLNVSRRRLEYPGTVIADDGIRCATPDAVLNPPLDRSDELEPANIQAKTSTFPDEWGDDGTDEVPDHVYIQVQHELDVLGLRVAFVPVLILSAYRDDWRLFRIDRDEEVAREIADRERVWWNRYVVARIPPTDDPPPIEILKRLPRTPKSSVEISDESAIGIVEDWLAAKEKAKAAADAEKIAKSRALALLGFDDPAEAGYLPDGRAITYLPQTGPSRVDTKRLRVELPDVYDRFVSTGTTRVLRLKKKAKRR